MFSLRDRDKIQKFQQWEKIHQYHRHVPRFKPTPPRIITIEVASLQESPSFSPYNDNQSTLILVSMFKINKDENLFLGRVERKESVVEKESVP